MKKILSFTDYYWPGYKAGGTIRAFMNQVEYLKVMGLLLNNHPLPPKYCNHPLKGDTSHYWDCHITNDCVLIYKISGEELRLARIGTHAELFKK